MKNHHLLKRLRGASAYLALLTLGTLSWGWALGQSNYIVNPEMPAYFSNYSIGLSPEDTDLSTMKGINNEHGVTYDPDAFVNAAENGSVMLPMPGGTSSSVQWRNFTTTDSYTGTIWDDVLQIWRPFTAFSFVESDDDLGAAVVFDDGDLAIVQFHEYRSSAAPHTLLDEAIIIYTDNSEAPNRAFIGRSRKLDLGTALGTAGTSGMPVGAASEICEVVETSAGAGGGAPTTAEAPASTAFEINGVRGLNIGLSYTAGVRGLLPSFMPISTHAVLYSSLANGVLRPELGLVLRVHFTHFVTEDLVADMDSDTGNVDKRALITQNMLALESSLSGLPTMHSGQMLMFGGGGVALLNSVCLASSDKYFGSSRLDEPFHLERLKSFVHEFGHQMGTAHTFNANHVQRAADFAYEAGSGYSIMGYPHNCPEVIPVPGGGSATVNHQVMGLTINRIRATPEWEDYYANVRLKFHTYSVEKMNELLNNNCSSLNLVPAVGPNVVLDLAHGTSEFSEAGAEIVPLGKPVLLAVTPEANTTYRWHQMDLGPADANPDIRATVNDDVGPKVAINGPTRDGMTFIPARDYLLGTATPNHHFSTLCDNAETSYNFRVQGNRFIPKGAPGAGSQGQTAISASNLVNIDCSSSGMSFSLTSGPWDAPAGTLFATTELGSGSNEALLQTLVTWNVAGTNAAPFSSNTVDIYRINGTDASSLEMIAEGIPNEGSIVLELPPSPIGEDGNPEDIRLLIKLPDAIWFELSDPFQILYAGCTDPNFDTYDPQANLHDPSECQWELPVPSGFGSATCMDLNACNYNPDAQVHSPNACTYASCNDPDALNVSFAVIAGVNAPANCTGGDCVYDEHACMEGAWLATDAADLGWGFHGPFAAEAWALDNWGFDAYSQFVSDYPNKLVFKDQDSRMHLIGGRTSSADGAQVMEASIVAAQSGLVTFDWQVVESSATNQSDLIFRRNGEVLNLPINANWSNSWRVDEAAPFTGSFSVGLNMGDLFEVVVITTADVETPVGVILSDFRYDINAVVGCMDPDALNFNPWASCGDPETCTYLENLAGSACYDPGACNFEGILPGVYHNPEACMYAGCMEEAAANYDPMAECEGPCCYTGDCDFASGGNLWGKYNETWEEYDPIPDFDEVMYLEGGMVLTSPQTTTPLAQTVSYTFNGSEAEKVSFMFAWVPGLMQLPADMLSPARFQVWEGSVLVQEYVLDENTGVPLSATAMDFPSQAFALPLAAWPGDPFEMDPTLESGALLHTYEELPTFEATFRGLEIDVLPGQEVRMVMYADSQDMVYDDTPCRLYITGAKMPQQCGVANADEFLGCMDPTACNYDPDANLDDGSCEAAGCMDPAALNYNEYATCQTACFYPSDCGNWLTADTDYAYGFNGAFAPGLAAENTIPTGLLITENNLMTIVGPDFDFGGTSGVAATHEISWIAQADMEVQFAYAASSYDSGYDFDRAFYRWNDAEVVLDGNAGELMENGTWLVTSEDWNPGPDYVLPSLADVPYAGFEDQIHIGLHLLKTPIPMLAGDTLTLGVKSDDNVFGPVVLAVMGMVWTDHCVAGPTGVDITGCMDPSACTYSPDANVHDDELCLYPGSPCNDGDACTFNDTMSDACSCKGDFQDADGDDVCDLDDVCPNNPDFTTEEGPCGCESIVDGNGNGMADCLELCDSDLDGDGVCDAEDGCPENPDLTEEGICGCFTPSDSDGDGICDEFEVPGCTDAMACNFNANATDDDGSCVFPGDACGDGDACTYNEQWSAGCECLGSIVDTDGDGICDLNEIPGCTDEAACNFDPLASDDDGSCTFSGPDCACSFMVEFDTDSLPSGESITLTMSESMNGGLDSLYVEVDFSPISANYAGDVLIGICAPNGNCVEVGGYDIGLGYPDAGGFNGSWSLGAFGTYTFGFNVGAFDLAGEGVWTIQIQNDFSDLTAEAQWEGTLYFFGLCSDPISGCLDEAADNYDPDATEPGTCYYGGCKEPLACNYDPQANIDDGSCIFPGDLCLMPGPCNSEGYMDENCNCQFEGPGDSNGNGICDDEELAGCTDELACNFDPEVTLDDGSCNMGVWMIPLEVGASTPAILACESDLPDGYVIGDFDCVQFVVDNDAYCINYTWDSVCQNAYEECLNACEDTDGDGVCDADEVPGCMDQAAVNYNSLATDDDGSCEYGPPCIDADSDGFCNDVDCDDNNPLLNIDCGLILGCTDITACNYDENAVIEDGSCIEPDYWLIPAFEQPGPALPWCGSVDEVPIGYIVGDYYCVDQVVNEYVSCVDFAWNVFGGNAFSYCEDSYESCQGAAGCMDTAACNYDSTATEEDGSCLYPGALCAEATGCALEAYYDENCECNPESLGADSDGDGICDEDEIPGCMNDLACNYNAGATDSDGSCYFVGQLCDWGVPSCDGALNTVNEDCECVPDVPDTDGDGICDEDEVAGCQDPTAYNYDPLATDDDGSCDYGPPGIEGCTDPSAFNFDPSATFDDGTCYYGNDDYYGCTDPFACNYNDMSVVDDGSCEYTSCGNECISDVDGDGICDDEEVNGCTDSSATNYNPIATDDDGSCDYSAIEVGCTYESACNYDPTANSDDGTCFWPASGEDCSGNCLFDANGDGLCDNVCDGPNISGCTDDQAWNYHPYATTDDGSCSYAPVYGCTDLTACNYDASAESDDGSCAYPPAIYLDCEGECISDTDGDGVCDGLESLGCTDPQAWNYHPYATDDDGSCSYAPVYGCTDLEACNYDASAESNDGSCTYPSAIHLNCEGACISDGDGDGICDEYEIVGCLDPEAYNYFNGATDPGVCFYAEEAGCTYAGASNYSESALWDDGTCLFDDGANSCPSDLNDDGVISISDLLLLLSAFGEDCE